MAKINCVRCNIEFYSKGRRKYCNTCLRIVSNSTIRRMIRNREFIRKYKRDKKCEICGYNTCPEILNFHHKDKSKKGEGICNLMKTLKNIKIIEKEMKKCILLCPNCHQELHLKERAPSKYTYEK